MVGFKEERERERLAWLSKLTQQAFQFTYKRDTKITRSHFFNFAKTNREENHDQGEREEERKSPREIERERGGFAQGKEEEKVCKFKPFSKPKPKVTQLAFSMVLVS